MVTYRTYGLTVVELWFDEVLGGIKPDIIFRFQSLVPIARGTSTDFYTLVVDLSQSEDDLLQQMTKENRYDIRRATEKDALTFWVWDRQNDEAVRRFARFYDEFAAGKGLASLSTKQIARLQQAECLGLSRVDDSQGNTLVWHAYYLGTNRVRLFYSASLFRKSDDSAFRSLVGRANRWLHWQDLRQFKAEHKTVYDFGGWYEGNSDAERLRINKFKETFGGKAQRNYHGQELVTFRGKVAGNIHRLLQRVRG